MVPSFMIAVQLMFLAIGSRPSFYSFNKHWAPAPRLSAGDIEVNKAIFCPQWLKYREEMMTIYCIWDTWLSGGFTEGVNFFFLRMNRSPLVFQTEELLIWQRHQAWNSTTSWAQKVVRYWVEKIEGEEGTGEERQEFCALWKGSWNWLGQQKASGFLGRSDEGELFCIILCPPRKGKGGAGTLVRVRVIWTKLAAEQVKKIGWLWV